MFPGLDRAAENSEDRSRSRYPSPDLWARFYAREGSPNHTEHCTPHSRPGAARLCACTVSLSAADPSNFSPSSTKVILCPAVVMVGFSLWRRIFLGTPREPGTILQGPHGFLLTR